MKAEIAINPHDLTSEQLLAIETWKQNKGLWSGDTAANIADLFARANQQKKINIQEGLARENEIFTHLQRRNQTPPTT